MTVDELARLDRLAFLAAFARIFEHSAWIAEAAWMDAPFHNFEHLHQAMTRALDAAGPEAAMKLVRAHPDLTGKAALTGGVTAESQTEQSVSSLSRLTPEELARFQQLNKTYHEKFGFPFVMAVRKSSKNDILAAFAARLQIDPATELPRALSEIETIAWLRLEAIAAA